MDIERIIEIVKGHERDEPNWPDNFERGYASGANNTVEDIVTALEKEIELQSKMTEHMENMPK